ncbi:hypothetical protein VTK56DRAFT_7797 [Thermocarpiscus australiensis]
MYVRKSSVCGRSNFVRLSPPFAGTGWKRYLWTNAAHAPPKANSRVVNSDQPSVANHHPPSPSPYSAPNLPLADRAPEPRSLKTVKTFSNLLNSVHHPYAGARCSASPGSAADSPFTR